MRRRTLLATVTGGVALTGCLSTGDGAPTASEPSPSGSSTSRPRDTGTFVRKTADGVTATFRIVDGHQPTEDTAHADFSEGNVTVTGTMDPVGCNEPTLASVSYAPSKSRIDLVVGESSPYGETATVECGNASFDFQSVVTVDEGQPTVVVVTYDHPTNEDQTFTLRQD